HPAGRREASGQIAPGAEWTQSFPTSGGRCCRRPEERPSVAFGLLVTTRNSATDSGVARRTPGERLGSQAQRQRDRVQSAQLIIIVRAVEGDIGLVATRPVDFAKACDPGLEREQTDYVAGVQRKLLDASAFERISPGWHLRSSR